MLEGLWHQGQRLRHNPQQPVAAATTRNNPSVTIRKQPAATRRKMRMRAGRGPGWCGARLLCSAHTPSKRRCGRGPAGASPRGASRPAPPRQSATGPGAGLGVSQATGRFHVGFRSACWMADACHLNAGFRILFFVRAPPTQNTYSLSLPPPLSLPPSLSLSLSLCARTHPWVGCYFPVPRQNRCGVVREGCEGGRESMACPRPYRYGRGARAGGGVWCVACPSPYRSRSHWGYRS